MRSIEIKYRYHSEWNNEEGQHHREDGPAVVWDDGDEEWWQYGKLHRLDGPAMISKSVGYKYWYMDGKRHRVDGPAIEYGCGNNVWYYQGKHIKCSSQEEFEKLLKLKAFW